MKGKNHDSWPKKLGQYDGAIDEKEKQVGSVCALGWMRSEERGGESNK